MDSGWLQKQGNSIRKGWRPRWFWVDHEQHVLKYAEKQGVRICKPLFGEYTVVSREVGRTEADDFRSA